MKKIILFLCSWFLFIPAVFAMKISPTTYSAYQYSLTSSEDILYKPFVRILESKSKQPYYDVTPKRTYTNSLSNYNSMENTFSSSFLSDASKIIYYGYDYQRGDDFKYYFATQYLIFSLFSEYDASVVLNFDKSDYFKYIEKEVNVIKDRLKVATFSLENFETTEKEFKISDPYILEHFTVSGDSLSISNIDGGIKVTFLDDKENYIIHFDPKKDCYDVTSYLGGASSVGLLGTTDICEKEYNIVVKNNNFQKKESISKIEPIKKQNEIKSEEFENTSHQEVQVPNTGKDSFLWLYLLLGMIGLAFIKK